MPRRVAPAEKPVPGKTVAGKSVAGKPASSRSRAFSEVAAGSIPPEALVFRLNARSQGNEIFEMHLENVGNFELPPVEIEAPAEMGHWISRRFIEDMGGEAPYDRVELACLPTMPPEHRAVLAWHCALDEANGRAGADLLRFTIPGSIEMRDVGSNGEVRVDTLLSPHYHAVTVFEPWEYGLSCRIGKATFHFRTDTIRRLERAELGDGLGDNALETVLAPIEELYEALRERNPRLSSDTNDGAAVANAPIKVRPERQERRDETFPLHTGEEWTAFIQAASDGKNLANFTGNEQSGILRHQRPNAGFYTETRLLEEERRAGHGLELLQSAAAQLDIDDGLAWLYISHVLAPPAPLAKGAYAGGWLDLDDVARKTLGGYARNPKEARERRVKVWRAIRYGARARIGGKRSIPYFDKTTGKEIPTEIYTSPWQIVSLQAPSQLPLFEEGDEEPPVRVELVASREWTALTTDSTTAQYLPFGEILGAIPSNQAGGAWARVLGLAYINWCRRRLPQAIAGEEVPCRRELLDTYPSKVAPYTEILGGKDPKRALLYWQAAESILDHAQIIECSATLYQPASRKGWQESWLSESPDWKPGALLRPVLEGLNARRFPDKPHALSAPARRIRRPKRRDLQMKE